MGKIKNTESALVWLRYDLRLEDNPALYRASEIADAVYPVFILDHSKDEIGEAAAWWLHYSLEALDRQFSEKGLRLSFFKGDPLTIIRSLCQKSDISNIFWNRLYEPKTVERDSLIKEALRKEQIQVETLSDRLLSEPWEIKNSSGKHFQVFTPFWKALSKHYTGEKPLPVPEFKKPNNDKLKDSIPLGELNLLPSLDWAKDFPSYWEPGELGAKTRLEEFLSSAVTDYNDQRNFPAVDGTSLLSPHLHFGELSPKVIWDALETRGLGLSSKAEPYLRQLAWRDFAHHLLFHYPETPERALREKYDAFPWEPDPEVLAAWQKGLTGYPIVDAGMRQLWSTGWMHNRVRMIVGSFLVKHLLQPWQAGAAWFQDTLVDSDLANNTMGWQWVAGCGADAAPYFRVFNPILQGEKFDKTGEYVKTWVPELSKLPKKFIHKPWEASPQVLKDSGVDLGKTYPKPIIDHAHGRQRALDALKKISTKNP